jgi:tetratricopeptide (TPR) repeat protein
MKYFKLLFMLLAVLNTACNNQNIKSNKNVHVNTIELQQTADTAYENEAWEDVIKLYSKLTKEAPDDVRSWYRIGNAYAHLNQTKSAISTYQIALTISPNNSMVLHNMGISQLQESTKTFIKLKEYADDDTLNTRAQLVINAISTLLNKEFKIDVEN